LVEYFFDLINENKGRPFSILSSVGSSLSKSVVNLLETTPPTTAASFDLTIISVLIELSKLMGAVCPTPVGVSPTCEVILTLIARLIFSS
jgi:hypothetical protein